MSGDATELKGPNLEEGIALSELKEGEMLLGHAGGEPVLVAKRGEEIFAVGAKCTHYGAPLDEGLMDGDTVRCPWHHACFSLRTGRALRAPALNPIARYKVQKREERLYVLGKSKESATSPGGVGAKLDAVVIVGGGAAGHAAAEMLRNEGYVGRLVLLSADPAGPVDRPNLSKDYLAGNAPEEWMPLRSPGFFEEARIELVLGSRARVVAIDVEKKNVTTESGDKYPYDALLLATGAEPVKLGIPGSELPHVHTLRTLADSRAIIAGLGSVKRAVVLGASFIGLEVAASLRERKIDVDVVAPDARPLEKILGAELGDLLRSIHEEHGVTFHLGRKAAKITANEVMLEDGTVLPADLVVVGVGVKPSLDLAEAAGIRLDRGVVVNAYMETSVRGIFAAGDIARWPDPHSGESLRVEHWVVAERHGQIAARNILGYRDACDIVPFFWSKHYGFALHYLGHADTWDRIDVDGSVADRKATLRYMRGDKTLAVVTLDRDLECLRIEVEMERA